VNNRKTILYLAGAGIVILLSGIFLVPFLFLAKEAIFNSSSVLQAQVGYRGIIAKSFCLAFLTAAISVILGVLPAKLLGTSRQGKFLIFVLLLMPLVLPPYILQYCWRILYSPTTFLGDYIATREHLAKSIEYFVSSGVMIFWFWPLAALLMSQGWQKIDKDLLQSASMETNGFGVFRKIILPLLAKYIIAAFGVCFILCISEFTTFHLAGIRTIGTELAVLYQSAPPKAAEAVVVRAAWPVFAAAIIVAVILTAILKRRSVFDSANDALHFKSRRGDFLVLITLFVISFVIPVFVLISSIANLTALKQFFKLHLEDTGWSILTCAIAALLAYLIAGGVGLLERIGRIGRCLFVTASIIIVTAMLVPAALIAVMMLKIMAIYNFPDWLRQSFIIVSAGLAIRYSAIALIVIILLRTSQQRQLIEMARLDGASEYEVFLHIKLPQFWRPFIGIILLIFMLGISETALTGILLPAGVPNFAQFLLNQMHYARDQQVIAACSVLFMVFIVLAIIFVLLIRGITLSRKAFLAMLIACTIFFAGCEKRNSGESRPAVLFLFGSSGPGNGEFLYPRAIDITSDGSIFIADRTGRIQQFDSAGKFIFSFKMPFFEKGYPTGISFSQDGFLYVADTHYSRVIVFSPSGKIIRQWGQYGEENGNFIYPTDVALADGKIFVSEYGGNDRISVFDPCGIFLFSFGSQGNGEGQFSRPAALCADKERKILYVADSCNHRIAIYDFNGKIQRYIGSPGKGAGELNYPYGLALLEGGALAVCEYGNNRIQVFNPDGKSEAVYGKAGRAQGQLAYPWGLAVDGKKRAYVVDSGNNRIQVWQL
jgi:ABC-type Fe3+ transport system permease subunit